MSGMMKTTEEPTAQSVDTEGTSRPASRARIRYNAALKFLRRAHLFAGLFMAPWVLLYGVTGFLFNHPEAFPDREVRTAGQTELVGTALEDFPTAPQLADRVVVLSARPAKIQEVVTIDIPHPRNLSSPRYLELRDELLNRIGLAYSV